jgi:hypothetical protein
MAAATEALAQEEWSLHTLAGFLFFHFYFIWASNLLDSCIIWKIGFCTSWVDMNNKILKM